MGTKIAENTVRRQSKLLLDMNRYESVILKAIILIVMDEINTLRAQHSLPPRTKSQLFTAIKNRIDTGDAD